MQMHESIIEPEAHAFDIVEPKTTGETQQIATGKDHPVIRAAIRASQAHGPLPNSAVNAVPNNRQDRQDVLGGKFK